MRVFGRVFKFVLRAAKPAPFGCKWFSASAAGVCGDSALSVHPPCAMKQRSAGCGALLAWRLFRSGGRAGVTRQIMTWRVVLALPGCP